MTIGNMLESFGQQGKARRAVAATVAGVPGWQDVAVSQALRLSRQSHVFAATIGQQPAILKRYLAPQAAAIVGRAETEIAAMSQALAGTGFAVNRMLRSAPAQGLILLEQVDGRLLSDLIRAGPPQERADHLTEAGHWLAAVIAPRQRMSVFGAQYWRNQAARLDPARLAPEAQGVARALIAMLDRRAAEIAGQPLLQAMSHGDFTPHNLMVTDSGMVGIDIQHGRWLAVAQDMGRFLVAAALRGGPSDRFAGSADHEALARVPLLAADEWQTTVPFFAAFNLATVLCAQNTPARRADRQARLAEIMLAEDQRD